MCGREIQRPSLPAHPETILRMKRKSGFELLARGDKGQVRTSKGWVFDGGALPGSGERSGGEAAPTGRYCTKLRMSLKRLIKHEILWGRWESTLPCPFRV